MLYSVAIKKLLGKTTTISRIEEHLIERGYHVLVLNECATEIIKGGIRPFGDNKVSVYDFQNEIINSVRDQKAHTELDSYINSLSKEAHIEKRNKSVIFDSFEKLVRILSNVSGSISGLSLQYLLANQNRVW